MTAEQSLLSLFRLKIVCVSGPGPMEESEEEYFPRLDQEGGGEEDDGAGDVWRRLHLPAKEKHQDLQRDSGGQVCELCSSAPVKSACLAFSGRFIVLEFSLSNQTTLYSLSPTDLVITIKVLFP